MGGEEVGGRVMAEQRENILRAVRFERPDSIPVYFHVNAACWHHYPAEALKELRGSHRRCCPEAESGTVAMFTDGCCVAGKPFTDGWGCVWETTDDGITGTVTKHPLSSWDRWAGYQGPDPEVDSGRGPVDWEQVGQELKKAKAAGKLAMGGLQHGHTFMTLSDIRGYENLLFDMADGEPRLGELSAMVEQFNLGIVKRYIELGAEWMAYPEDLGMQVGPMISPGYFRKYIRGSYERIMEPARKAGCVVHMHSDGDIHELIDDIIGSGVDVMNLQDLVNGIDWIRDRLKGKTCIELDIDRQKVTRFGSPAEIDALIRQEVETLGSAEGGLMMVYGLYPGVPLQNAKAVADAMEKYSTLYS